MTGWPPVDKMIARNEELLAERLNWPGGALEQKRALAAAHPGWRMTWSPGGVGDWREPGWYAWPGEEARFHPPRFYVYRKTAAGLGEVLALAPEPRPGWTPPGGWLPVS